MDKSAGLRGGSGGCGWKPPSGMEESPPLTRMDNGESMINNTCNHSHKPPDLARIARRGISALIAGLACDNRSRKTFPCGRLRWQWESLIRRMNMVKNGNQNSLPVAEKVGCHAGIGWEAKGRISAPRLLDPLAKAGPLAGEHVAEDQLSRKEQPYPAKIAVSH